LTHSTIYYSINRPYKEKEGEEKARMRIVFDYKKKGEERKGKG